MRCGAATGKMLTRSLQSVESILSLPPASLQTGLEKFARLKSTSIQGYLNDLAALEKQAASRGPEETALRADEESQKAALPVSIAEYPLGVNTRLYETLYDGLRCACLQSGSTVTDGHLGKLRLRCSWLSAGDNVVFDMLLSGRPHSASPLAIERHPQRTSNHWQQIRLHVPRYVPRTSPPAHPTLQRMIPLSNH